MAHSDSIQDAQKGDGLETLLTSMTRDGIVDGVAVAVVSRERSVVFAARGGTVRPETKLPIGCVVKVMTATVLSKFLAEKRISVESNAGELAAANPDVAAHALQQVRLSHLLNHTHGLSPQMFGAPGGLTPTPRTPSGYIDLPLLCAVVDSEEELFPPGRFYSYGHTGYGFLGAVVERLTKRPFAETLEETLLSPLSIASRVGDSGIVGSVCPATGDGLSVSADELSRFLEFCIDPERFSGSIAGGKSALELLLQNYTSFPGWSPGIVGAFSGWKDLRDGWVGHNGGEGRAYTALRYHPQQEIGIALVADGPKSTRSALGRAFNWLPEFRKLGPLLLTPEEIACVDLRKYEGRYRNGFRTHVLECEDGALMLTVEDRVAGKIRTLPRRFRLMLRADHMFFILPPHDENVFLIEFVGENRADGHFDYVWNGWCLWKRED